MFYVWEGNHRVTTWLHHIERHHCEEKNWHYFVDPKGSVGVLLNAMNDVNQLVETTYSQSNLIFFLFQLVFYDLYVVAKTMFILTTQLRKINY
jgi:hypothetical protein